MRTIFQIIVVFLLLIIFSISCNRPDQVEYSGELIEIDFKNVENIQSGLWIKFDEWKFTHVESIDEGNLVDFPLPTDYIIFDRPENRDRPLGTPVNPTHIGLHIGRHLRDINLNKLEEGVPKYNIPNPGLLSAIGVLRIAKTDSSAFTITVPADYPIPIRVINEE